MTIQKRRIGKGLEALMGDNVSDEKRPGEQVLEADVFLVDNNPSQPRKKFDGEKLEELAQSIRAHGIMQPLIVAKEGERYRIVAGERRFRAAKIAGLSKIPVIVREFDDRDKLELALIENVQREDLNPIEQARALKTLIENYNLTQNELSRRVGKNRSTIANLMRLLELPDSVVKMVEDGDLSGGHARALLSLKENYKTAEYNNDQIERAALAAVTGGWSVRDTESYVKSASDAADKNEDEKSKKPNTANDHNGDFGYAEEKMSEALETRVQIKGNNNKGKIIIDYYSREQLEQLYEAINTLL